jgi:hypothetical protein
MNIATSKRTGRDTSRFSWYSAEWLLQLALVCLVVGAVVERGSAIV